MTNRLRAAWSKLDETWFGPASYTDLALLRIVVVSGHVFLFYPSLEQQLSYASAHPDLFLSLPALKVLLLPLGEWGIRPDPTLLRAVWLVGIVSGISALVGKYTRLSLFIHAASATLLVAHIYSYGTVHHPRGLLIIALWALAFSRCGRAWSLDDLSRRMNWAEARGEFEPMESSGRRGILARWPLLLIQWVLALAYFSAGMSKLVNGGIDWFGSSTLAHYLVQDALRQDRPLGLVLASAPPEFLTTIAVGVVIFELAFPLAVILPRTAWFFLLVGAGMHVGILLTQGAPFLQWSLLYIAFLPSLRNSFPVNQMRRIARRVIPPSDPDRKWTVVYDGHCGFCIRTMVVIDYLDLGRRVIPVDLEREWERVNDSVPSLTREHARHAMHVITPESHVLGGFEGFRELVRALPLLWPLLPLTSAPFAGRLGNPIYEFIASRRVRLGPCGEGQCIVP